MTPTLAPAVDSDHPDWLEDAAEVYSRVAGPGNAQEAEDVPDARDALEAAGIPCYLDLTEHPEETVISPPSRLWRILVPGNLNLRATSVLDRDIFNQEFEATWRTHLETLSDAELRQMSRVLGMRFGTQFALLDFVAVALLRRVDKIGALDRS